jgi:predicted alpha/beta-hydrolase family hydrolase
MSTLFVDTNADPAVRGFLHVPARGNGSAIVLTHGAGANCQSKLLIEMSNAFAGCGFTVLRCDLPFRQLSPHGPPSRGSASRDRDGIRRAVAVMKERAPGPLFLGGHSYGGRQATMLISEEPQLVDGLLLLSYPLHPPRKPDELRTSHFPKLSKPAFFVHGTRDPFGTTAEMKSALEMIPGPHALLEVDGAGHELLPKKTGGELPARIVNEFQIFLKQSGQQYTAVG